MLERPHDVGHARLDALLRGVGEPIIELHQKRLGLGAPEVLRNSLCAIVSSQFSALRGLVPCASERYAFRKVCGVTSSASARSPSTAKA